MRHTLILLCCLVILPACRALEGGGEVLRPATIHMGGKDSVILVAPPTAQAGTPFDVSVRSYGGGCVTKGETVVNRPSELVAEILPYDREITGEGVACTAELRLFEHRVSLTFATPGSATVKVAGRTIDGSVIGRTRTVVVE